MQRPVLMGNTNTTVSTKQLDVTMRTNISLYNTLVQQFPSSIKLLYFFTDESYNDLIIHGVRSTGRCLGINIAEAFVANKEVL